MKKILLVLFFFCFKSLCFAQQIISQRDTILPDGRRIRLVTTPRGSDNQVIQKMLTPGHQFHKIVLQDSVNKLDFEVKYFLEEYQNDNLIVNELGLHSSFKSFYNCELIINRMADEMISIIMQIPGFSRVYYIPNIEVENFVPPIEKIHYKWKIFSKTLFEKSVPVFLIYNENPDEDTVEKNMEILFQSSSFQNLTNKDKIVAQIKSLTDHFYLLLYDVILTK